MGGMFRESKATNEFAACELDVAVLYGGSGVRIEQGPPQ